MEVFNKLDSAAKINIAFGFVLRNVEMVEYRYYYAYENNTLFEKSHLLCTKADLIKIQGKSKKSFYRAEMYSRAQKRFHGVTRICLTRTFTK